MQLTLVLSFFPGHVYKSFTTVYTSIAAVIKFIAKNTNQIYCKKVIQQLHQPVKQRDILAN